MSFRASKRAVAIGAAVLSVTLVAPSSSIMASPAPEAAVIEAVASPVPAISANSVPSIDVPAPLPAPAPIAAPQPEPAPAPARTAEVEVDAELECLAKVVLHEAGNQSRTGQIAVAEVVMNRVRSPRFPNTICGVVMQRGQFFNVHAYRPYRDRRWPRALEIAREVRDGETAEVTNGAFFFRAAHGAPFRGRTRVATIQDHSFYR